MPGKIETDGIVDFSGGMDTYSSPYLLANNQFNYSVNCKIVPGKSGIQTRSGYREIYLEFQTKQDKEFFQTARIQGCGYYSFGNTLIILLACSGRLYKLTEVNKSHYIVRYLRMDGDEHASSFYFTNIPLKGCIINDGTNAPILAFEDTYERQFGLDKIRPGRAGIYIQNRFFYISADGLRIEFSSINLPISRTEAIGNNLLGFYSPDDTEIVAIGEQKTIGRDSNGGSLIFSTRKNIYSIDVSGAMSSWGLPTTSQGKTRGDLYDVSAVSPFSMVSMNGNCYFRSKNLGLVSLQYLQYIFNNVDIIETQSYGAHLFFNNDDVKFLQNCYSVKHNNTIYTTVSPTFEGNSVVWSGLISCVPGQKGIIRYDSLLTGIRPWCMINIEDHAGEDSFYLFSKDHDDINRMYVMDHDIDYDLPINKNISEIESKIASRFYIFKNPLTVKKTAGQKVQITPKSTKVKLTISTRQAESESFQRINYLEFNSKILQTERIASGEQFVNKNITTEERRINYADSVNSNFFLECQDLFEIVGSFHLSKSIRVASVDVSDQAITQCDKEKLIQEQPITYKDLYSYKLQG